MKRKEGIFFLPLKLAPICLHLHSVPTLYSACVCKGYGMQNAIYTCQFHVWRILLNKSSSF